jgi:hypothetical protein
MWVMAHVGAMVNMVVMVAHLYHHLQKPHRQLNKHDNHFWYQQNINLIHPFIE